MSAGGGDGGDGGGTDGVKWNECVVLCGVCAGEEGFTQVMFHDADILMCECVCEGTFCDSESTGHGGECGSESGESTKGWCQRDTSFTKFFCTGEIGCSWVDVRKLLYRGGLGE